MSSVPIIDISPLLTSSLFSTPSPEAKRVAADIYNGFTTWGLIQIVGHNVSIDLQEDLLQCAKDFFALPEDQKLALHIKNGGAAWRGYMPQGGEGTHGRVDHKEGLYCGPEHQDDHVNAGSPLHGKNQFPDLTVPNMRPTILKYIKEMENLGMVISDAISLSLGLDGHYMRDNFLQPEPIDFFRCWKYSLGTVKESEEAWGIGEHSDFGYLTLLKQESPGLQILSPQKEWVNVPVVENAFVCNVGDMLDMLTGGRFISPRHRVLPPAPGSSRFSFPLFFDFSWTAKMVPLPLDHLPDLTTSEKETAKQRWAKTSFTSVSGEWWQYLAKKVHKIRDPDPHPDLKDFLNWM